jgi:hypothetical protein
MFFAFGLAALVASILPLVSAVAVPSGYKNVTTDDLSSLVATSNFVIASTQFGTSLNIPGGEAGDGGAVILYANAADPGINAKVE